ncbi:hypothetical protein BAE44_0003773 [Dichanthelium oligosanthes]|uniref:NEP1-interacting protein-like 2 n=1 Tax=Dichanthelium oligosanthes TaxID=888268 RepID=A0A1E5WCT9_9POAL|nr:hypothetical protein BAE44_0003773 [Dichanthelium oligosanthes]
MEVAEATTPAPAPDEGGLDDRGAALYLPRLLAGVVSGALTGLFALGTRTSHSHLLRSCALRRSALCFLLCFSCPVLSSVCPFGACAGCKAGALTGAVTGAVAGRASDSGVLRGAGLGAFAGAVLSIEADFIEQLIQARIVQERFASSGYTSSRWQVSISDFAHDDLYDIFGDISSKGISQESLKKLPHYVITDQMRDSFGEILSCPICLQVEFMEAQNLSNKKYVARTI